MSDMKYVRKAIEDTYIGTCDVIEYRKTRNQENKQNEYSEEDSSRFLEEGRNSSSSL